MLAAASSEATDPSPILAKGRRKGKVARQQPQLPTALLAPAEALASAVELLELVLERGYDTEEIQLLVQPVQELLARAVDALDVQTGRAASGEEEEAEASVAAGQLMYLLQLTLSCLSMLASQPMVEPASTATATGRRGKQQQQQQQGAFDLALAVRAAQIVRNDNARDAALELITHIALAAPQAALEHALDIVAVAGKVASLHVEERSAAASMQALAAVVPAWLQSSCSLEELVGTAVTAAARMALHRRAPMLAALTAALPAVDGLATVLLLLLRSATEEQAAAADATVMPWTINAATAVLKQARGPKDLHMPVGVLSWPRACVSVLSLTFLPQSCMCRPLALCRPRRLQFCCASARMQARCRCPCWASGSSLHAWPVAQQQCR